MASFPEGNIPYASDSEQKLLVKIAGSVNTTASSGGTIVATPIQTQVTCTSAASALATANAAGQAVSLFNNGLVSIWIALDGSAPVADTGSEGTPNGNGVGIRIYPGGFYETPARITTAIKGITLSSSAKTTVTVS